MWISIFSGFDRFSDFPEHSHVFFCYEALCHLPEMRYICIMITVSEKAKQRALSLIKEEGKPADTFIRVGVEGGGCSGLSYKLSFDNEKKEGDQVFEDKGMKIVVDKKSFLYLVGTELDFSGGLNGKGFEFKNPNASRTCGCGESFAV
jgi:iron-sulfur cluster assembly protein